MLQKKFKKLAALLVFVFIAGACNKPDDRDSQYEFQVLEYSTNNPIAGATVDGYKCLSKDWLGNCMTTGTYVASTTSNNEGKIFFQKSLDIGVLKTRKDKYWDHENSNMSLDYDIPLTPVSILKVHVIKVNTHPAGYVLNLVSQSQGCSDCPWETKQVGQPLDTYVYLKGAGYYNNSVGWYMNPGGPASGSSTPSVLINRFDTAQFEVRY